MLTGGKTMNCFYHKDIDATSYCGICGKPICDECKNNIGNTIICKSCGQKALKFLFFSKNEKFKSKGLVFLFSLFPGAGYMYLGLMNRGIQIMAAFFLALALPDIFFNNFIFQSLAIIIYVYNIFDAQNQAILYNSGEGKDLGFIDKEFIKKHQNVIGLIIIAIGVWGIISQIFNQYLYSTINKFLIPFGFIILGIYLLKDIFLNKRSKSGV